jgi:hypothetical protein
LTAVSPGFVEVVVELIVLVSTGLLVLGTWLLYRLVARLESSK